VKAYRLTGKLIIIIVTLVVVTVLAGSAILYWEIGELMQRLGRSFATERVEAVRTEIGDLLQRETSLARRMAESPAVKRWIRAEENAQLREQAFAELQNYAQGLRDPNYFVTVHESETYYNKQQGEPVAVSSLSRESDSDQWYYQTIASGEAVSLNLDYNVLIQETRVWINCLVRSGDTTIGMAGTGLDLSGLIRRLVEAQDQGVQLMLVDSDGTITAHPDKSILEHNATAGEAEELISLTSLADDEESRRTIAALRQEAVAGGTAVAPLSLGGARNLTAVASIPRIGWQSVVSVDTGQFVSVADFVPLFVLLALAIILGIVLIAVVMQRLVLRPLQLMTDSANRIAAGHYELSLPDQRRDEMGDLARSFNYMTDRVREYTATLEQKVEDRTKELRALNEHMSESISYAGLLQRGLMPSRTDLAQRLSHVSLFHRQRDGVGGDAVFLRDTSAGYLLAVIDCEGHGVSGALMTMTVDSLLKSIASRREIQNDPAQILTELEDAVRNSLRTAGAVEVGLEIGVCACDPTRGNLRFAAAGMPLYLRESDGTVHTVKSRGKSIGKRRTQASNPFENHELSTHERSFALVTDGYVDQVGGSRARAFGTRRLTEMLAGCDPSGGNPPCPEWERVFDEYKGDSLQRDDVLAIGFTV